MRPSENKLEFRSVDFYGGRKTGNPEKIPQSKG
jgi:hypothetical protein